MATPVVSSFELGSGFTDPISFFDVHVYFKQYNKDETAFATKLHQTIIDTFPQIRYRPVRYEPVGPHIVGQFLLEVLAPADLGVFISWLLINRGPLSVLLHPHIHASAFPSKTNLEIQYIAHTRHTFWIGQPHPLDLTFQGMLDENGNASALRNKHDAEVRGGLPVAAVGKAA
ncbi:hypothetical protein M427DRAFT_144694 [Gonapodya prolifera JEL478]|uniref:Dopa 4,5-dioxygenase n=1 Tax=Gonapodya prolifera (strain JEL478) TaxID=1344416 RepID=A0A139AIT7_GONPJ|nr:hypothetical protein M427DRAFT_144694 [Gonapodya prolifera JEL478]|eukprot:KXS16629.1 hypothetical protein M427DRAFT_144694 [Gonapodya prolifera JEL478]